MRSALVSGHFESKGWLEDAVSPDGHSEMHGVTFAMSRELFQLSLKSFSVWAAKLLQAKAWEGHTAGWKLTDRVERS